MTSPSIAVTIEGPAEVLELLRSRLQSLDLPVSATTLVNSGGDALDAPLSGRKLVAALGIVTALFNAGTSALEFAQEVQQVLADHPGVTLMINDALTNDPLTSVTAGMAATAIAAALQPTDGQRT